MPDSILQVNLIKDKGGNATGITVADSSANVTIGNLTHTAGSIGSSVVFPAGGTGNPISVASIVDQKANNVEGGTFTQDAWQTRDLNTEISDPDSIVSISSNQFTLGAGTYLISWSAPAFVVTSHQSKLYSVSLGDLRIGTPEYSNNSNASNTISTGQYVHTISASHSYEIRHRCSTSRSVNGFGSGVGYGTVNIFTQVLIQKLK
tara:strand:+ start:2750 stop:3364 length:615 start_codon:yes stop_codon:yes gene_type:complete